MVYASVLGSSLSKKRRLSQCCSLQGLNDSPVAESFVAACHATTAQGICTQNDIGYLKASNMIDMQLGIVRLLTAETKRPMLLEVFTDGGEDARVVREYYSLP